MYRYRDSVLESPEDSFCLVNMANRDAMLTWESDVLQIDLDDVTFFPLDARGSVGPKRYLI